MASDRRPAPMKKSKAAGLVALSALLALSASGTTVAEAARITNVGSSGGRGLQTGDQCAKCCGPPKAPKPVNPDAVFRDDGGDTAGAGGAGKGGKGGKGLATGGGGRRLTKVRRGAGRHQEADTTPERELQAQAELKAPKEPKPPGAPKEPKGKCVVCGDEEQKTCKLTASQAGTQGLKAKVCPTDVPSKDCPDQFVVETIFEGNTGYATDTFYNPSREGGTEIDLDLQGGCGTKIAGTEPTIISFYMKAAGDGEPDDVADYLQENLGKKAFCGADEAPSTGEQEEIFIAPLPKASPGGRKLGESFVTGFVPCDEDAFKPTNQGCGKGSPDNCHVYLGCAKVYCKHNASMPQCYGDGVQTLQKNAGNAVNPPLITSVEVIGASMEADNAGNGANSDVASIIGLETNDGGDSSISAVGIGLAAGFSVLAALIVLLAVRKNRRAYTRDISFLDMEDMCSVDGDNIHLKPGDSSFDGTEIMSEGGTPSPAGSKWRKSRPGHVVDEDDSVLSGNNRQIVPRELVYGGALAPSNLARDHSTLDVHQCNSAMCEICLSRGVNPRFVPAHLEDSYHVEGDDRLNASDLSYGSRNYPMEDTVDF